MIVPNTTTHNGNLSAFKQSEEWKITESPNPNWIPGSGANSEEWKEHKKISFNPADESRLVVDNYRTVTSAIVPRPIGFVSSVDKDGNRNLAPFSYFSIVHHDPPMFCLSFSGSTGSTKDTCKNILDTKELTVSLISEWFVEAANYTCINSPRGIDEWELSGLTPAKSEVVTPPHVAESAFSFEAKLVSSQEWASQKNPGTSSGVTLIVEAVRFHVREDVINQERNYLDISKLKPVSRLGGNLYARTTDGYDLARPDYQKELAQKK